MNRSTASDALAAKSVLILLHEDLTRVIEEIQSLRQVIEQKIGPGQADYLSIKQAAALAGLSATKVRREVKAGRLPASNAGTQRHPLYRIARADLLAWMEGKKGGTSVPPKVPLYEPKGKSRHFPEL